MQRLDVWAKREREEEEEEEEGWELVDTVPAPATVEQSCESRRNTGPFVPLLVLIPLRLGSGATINTAYCDALLRAFHFPTLIGIAGGKPRSSFFFYGCQGERVFLSLLSCHSG